MESKKQAQKRQKRQPKFAEVESCWDCSVCTFRNTAEAFKCAMCDVRKGTSTRKPRLNPQLVAQQVAQTIPTPPPKPRREDSKERNKNNHTHTSSNNSETKNSKKKVRNIRPRLKNIDRSQVHRQPVTVNNITVVITEFLPKSVTNSTPSYPLNNSTDLPSSSDVTSNQSEIISVNGETNNNNNGTHHQNHHIHHNP